MITHPLRQALAKTSTYRPFATVFALAVLTLGAMWLFR
jgi:hypothetical protein